MLLPNLNALILVLMLWYFLRPSWFIDWTITMVASLDRLLLRVGRTQYPSWLLPAYWIADLVWVPVLVYGTQPAIAQLVLTGIYAERAGRLFLALILCNVLVFIGLPLLTPWLMGEPSASEDQHDATV